MQKKIEKKLNEIKDPTKTIFNKNRKWDQMVRESVLDVT